MQRKHAVLLAAAMSVNSVMAAQCPDDNNRLTYPDSQKVGQVDDYHGVKVADPYRWLEDGNSPQTQAWISAQNQLTQSFLAQIPERTALRQRLTTLWNYERYSVPFKEGGRYFISRNDGLQNQAVLYTMPTLDAAPRVLLDPNTLATDGTIALAGMAVSPDGNYLAYGTAVSGSDWNNWKIRDIDSGKDLDDELRWVKFSGASWTKDGKGFFYSRYDAPNEATKLADTNYFQKLYFHRLGTAQADDTLVYDRPDHKDWGFGGAVTDDGKYLIITISQGTERKSRIYYKDLANAGNPVLPLLDGFDAAYTFIDNNGPVFLFVTDNAAPRSRIVAIDIRKPAPAHWKELVAQAPQTLLSASAPGGRLVASYLQDAHSQVKVFDLNGTLLRELALPGIGTAAGFGGKRDDAETFYSYTGFTTPSTIYRYDIASDTSSVVRQPTIAFDPAQYETRQVFFNSKDGTRVPMFIVHKKGIPLDGSNPTYLYGYGGFNISLTPAFSVANLAWMEMGGVYAVASLRGGGEYGERWHQAGTKLQKQNVFDDFIGAAEWLIANKVTSTTKLAIGGGSNGGLLVGAALTQRPELFGAALPAVGVMDMLRFHKFTIGWAWTSDYGSADDATQFKALYAYSPLHNLRAGTCYPATLVTTADHDDRVVPAHSFKFAAAEQAAQGGAAPVLIRIETKAGHGAGKPTGKLIEEVTDRWGFLIRVLGMAPLRTTAAGKD
ncbi:prolyl oligopeptidase family serine peptidase [Actimicrobium antarcticum]|uniref:prolyl oligopeptidase n=1 Tax=Actimicrobium antarcticum TaxID=1051899 RepID=A0ABP7TE60_9BURK